jgi:hypothetical protein
MRKYAIKLIAKEEVGVRFGSKYKFKKDLFNVHKKCNEMQTIHEFY